jgi:hypothetical protein
MEIQNKPEVTENPEKENSGTISQVTNASASSASDELLDLRFLFSEIRRKWWLVLIFVLIGAFIGGRDLHRFSGVYVAKMVVSPIAAETSAGGRGNTGIVSVLAGFNLGETEKVSKFDRLAYMISTVRFAEALEEKYHLMEEIFGAGLDKTTNTWIKPSGLRFELKEKLNNYFNFSLWAPPTIEDLANFIGGSIEIEKVKATPFRVVAFKHRSPEKALQFLKLVYGEAEYFVKQKDIEELANQRSFLEESYSKENIIDFRQALVSMMADQARKEMMSQGSLPSVARIVEPPYVSKYKTVPNVLRVLLLPILGGVGIAVGLIILLGLIRKE